MSAQPYSKNSVRSGFTLVEIMVVVVIIGLLAAIAIPTFALIKERSRAQVFANDLRMLRDACALYYRENGELPDSGSANIWQEAGLAAYLDASFDQGSDPIVGGVWDTEGTEGGANGIVRAGAGVDFQGVPPYPEVVARADAILDNGDVNTGEARFVSSSRYYWVLDE